MLGYGPETITIKKFREGKYRYRVAEYKGKEDNREALLNSRAQVTVHTEVHSCPSRSARVGFKACSSLCFLFLHSRAPDCRRMAKWSALIDALCSSLYGSRSCMMRRHLLDASSHTRMAHAMRC